MNEQTHPDIEHIVVDGGSTDVDDGDRARSEGRRVTTALSEPDRGIYDAMNKGLRLARGDVIGLINSDDFLASPDVLSTIAAAFADPDIDAVYGDLCYVEPVDTTAVVRYWRSSPVSSAALRARLGAAASDPLRAPRSSTSASAASTSPTRSPRTSN